MFLPRRKCINKISNGAQVSLNTKLYNQNSKDLNMNSNISQNCFLKIKRSEMLLINVQFVYCMTTSDSILKFSEGSLEEISETTPLSLVSDERATSEQRRAELHETEFRKDPFRGQTHIHKYLLYREMLRKHTCVKEGLHHSRRYTHMLLYEQHAADSRDWLMGLHPFVKKTAHHNHTSWRKEDNIKSGRTAAGHTWPECLWLVRQVQKHEYL